MNHLSNDELLLLRAEEGRVQALRDQIPITNAVAYLNTGTSGPLPRKVYDKIREFLDSEYADGRISMKAFQSFFADHAAVKANLARLLNTEPRLVFVTPSTSAGMTMAAHDIDWNPGDEVITIDIEYPAIKRIFYSLERRRGIVGRSAQVGVASGDITALIDEQITEKTKAVALSHVSYTNGAVFDIAQIARLCRERGIITLIDGAQSVGAIPVDVTALDIDYYAFAGQKWLCGPSASGGLYVHPDRRQESSPYEPEHSIYPSLESDYYFENDRRFEVMFKTDLASLGGLATAVQFILDDVGIDWAQDRAHRLARYAVSRLSTVPGLTMHTPEAFGTLIALTVNGQDPHDVVVKLFDQNIQTRSIPDTTSLRISTHYFNTVAEVDRVVDALATIASA